MLRVDPLNTYFSIELHPLIQKKRLSFLNIGVEIQSITLNYAQKGASLVYYPATA